MKVLAACFVLVALASAQQQDAQQGLREFLQHLINLENRYQRGAQEEGILVSNAGVPLVEIPDQGVYEVYQDPSDVYYRDQGQDNDFGYNYDKYESAGKLSYHAPELYRPKRQAPAPAAPSDSSNPNRISTFISNIGALSTNIRRQTSEAIRNTLRGNPPIRLFPGQQQPTNPIQAAVAAHKEAQKPTSLNDVYGATLGARSNRNRNRRSVDQTYSAVFDYAPLEVHVQRSQDAPQVALFNAAGDRFRLIEEPPFEPLYVVANANHGIAKRSAPVGDVPAEHREERFFNQEPFADVFRPLQEIFGIVNATAQAIFRDVVPAASKPVKMPPGFSATSKHEFKINEREGTVVETEAKPSGPDGPVTAKIQMTETYFNPNTEKIETVTRQETVVVPVVPPWMAAPATAFQSFDPSKLTETLEKIALPFQRAFTNFTTELGLSIFKATRPEEEVVKGASGGDIELYPPPEEKADEPRGEVTLDYFKPQKKDKNIRKPATTVFVIKEENIYPPKTDSNVVPNDAAKAIP